MAIHQQSEFTLAATGDAILTRDILSYEGQSTRFDSMVALFRGADAALTNLEVIVHNYEPAPAANSGGTYMRAPPSVLDELEDMGFSLFSAATNHTYDYGQEGVERTLAELRRRNLTFAGIGETLFEARQPGYLETPAGRIALVSICTSMPPGSQAGEQTASVRGRPGLNPLHVERVYRLHKDRIENLHRISEAAGIETMKQSWLDRGLYYNHDWDDPDYFHFADMKFDSVEDENAEGITHEVDETDREALYRWIADAEANADWVIVTVHTHQGASGRQNTEETPKFLVDLARRSVDAGADAIVCHGPHVLRGIEVYDGAPVFYSLGNYIVQNETVSRLPAESFDRYGLDNNAMVSDVFTARLYNEEGNPKGDLANEAFWKTVIPVSTFGANGHLNRVELHPCTLQRDQSRPQRGIPVLATEKEAHNILEQLISLSQQFNTNIKIDDGVGIIDLD